MYNGIIFLLRKVFFVSYARTIPFGIQQAASETRRFSQQKKIGNPFAKNIGAHYIDLGAILGHI